MLFVAYGGGAVWPSTDLTYSYSNLFDAVWNAGPNDDDLRAAAEEAMGAWASVTPLTFTQIADSGPLPTASDDTYDAETHPLIRWGHHLIDGPPVAGMPNTLAHAYRPGTGGRNGDIHFDTGDTFTVDVFLETATHEIGHTLGLDHPNGDVADYDGDGDTECPASFASIMHACIGGGGTWDYAGLGTAFLLQDDIDGIRSLYDAGLGYVLSSTGQLSVFGTSAADIFNVSYTSSTNMLTVANGINSFTRTLSGVTQVAINGQGGDDLISVGQLPSNVIVDVNGGAGSDILLLRGTEGGDTLRVASSTLAFNNNGPILFDSISSITLNGFGGADTFEVVQLPANLPVTINGGDQNDVIRLANAGSTGAINAAVTINGENGDDTVYLAANAPAGISVINASVTFNGGANFDTLYVGSGSLSAVSGLVNFNAGGGKIYLDDSNTAFFVDYNISNTSINRAAPFFFGGVNYTGVSSIELNATQGPNTVVLSTTTVNSAIINGNGGDDNFVIGNGNNLAGGIGLFTGNGGPGFDTLTLNDSLSTHDLPWAVLGGGTFDPQTVYLGLQAYDTEGYENVSLLLGNGNNSLTIDGTMTHSLSVDLGGGNDSVTLTDVSNYRDFVTQNGEPAFSYTMELAGGTGFNTLTMDDRTSVDRYYFLDDGAVSLDEGAPLGLRYAYDDFQSMTVLGGNYGNEFRVFGTSADIPAGQQTTIYGGTQQDLFIAYPHDADGNLTFLSGIGFVGGGATDTFYLDDSANSVGFDWTINNFYGAGTQSFGFGGTPIIGTLSDLENLYVLGSQGDDTFNVDEYRSGTALRIFGNAGTDVAKLSRTAKNLPGSIIPIAYFSFDGGVGSFDKLEIYNDNSTNAWTYTRDVDYVTTVQAGYTAQWNHPHVEHLLVHGGAAADTFLIQATPPYGSDTYIGAGGDDQYTLGKAGRTNLIRNYVAVINDAGTDSALIDNTADTIGRTVHVDEFFVEGATGDDLFGPDGYLYHVNLTGNLVIQLGSGADSAYVVPNTLTRLVLHGNNPASTPGDFLGFAFADAVNPVHSAGSFGFTHYDFDNRRQVSYRGFESTTIDAVAPFVVSQRYDESGLVPVLLSEFSENVLTTSRPLNQYYLEVINTTTGTQVEFADMALAYDALNNSATITFPGLPNGRLPAGDYTARWLAGPTDFYGNALADQPALAFTPTPPLTGDFDQDHEVGPSDYALWKAAFGLTVAVPGEGADGNGDGKVDIADYAVWRDNLGAIVVPLAPADAVEIAFGSIADETEDNDSETTATRSLTVEIASRGGQLAVDAAFAKYESTNQDLTLGRKSIAERDATVFTHRTSDTLLLRGYGSRHKHTSEGPRKTESGGAFSTQSPVTCDHLELAPEFRNWI